MVYPIINLVINLISSRLASWKSLVLILIGHPTQLPTISAPPPEDIDSGNTYYDNLLQGVQAGHCSMKAPALDPLGNGTAELSSTVWEGSGSRTQWWFSSGQLAEDHQQHWCCQNQLRVTGASQSSVRTWTKPCSTPCVCALNWGSLIPLRINPIGSSVQVPSLVHHGLSRLATKVQCHERCRKKPAIFQLNELLRYVAVLFFVGWPLSSIFIHYYHQKKRHN